MDNRIEEMANDLQETWTAWSLSKDLKNPYAFVAEILAKKWQPKIPEGVVDYIENYKEGFKEGVIAFRTQLEERAFKTIKCVNGVEVMPPVNYSLSPTLLDEICKGLVDE